MTLGLARCVLYSKNLLGFLGAIKGQPEWFHSARGAAWIRDIPRHTVTTDKIAGLEQIQGNTRSVYWRFLKT